MTLEEIKKDALHFALHTYGTHHIYSVKYQNKNRWLKAITLLGFMTPVLLGGVVSSYGFRSEVSEIALYTLTPLGLLQLIISTLSLIYRWDDQANYYLESSISNRVLSDDFSKLAKYPDADIITYKHSYDILLERNKSREEQDDKYPFTLKESRQGLRYALRQFQQACVSCGCIPTSMISTECEVCGNF